MFIYKNKINYVNNCLIPNRKTLHPLLKDYDELQKPYSQQVYDGLEIFKDYDDTETKTLMTSINKTQTMSGHIKLQNMLMNKQNHKDIQKNYKLLIKNYDTVNDLIKQLEPIEESLLIYCDDKNSSLNEIMDNVTLNFPYVNKLNNNKLFLNLYNNYHIFSPLLTIVSPLVMFVITYLFSKFAFFKYVKYMTFNIPSLDAFKDGNYLSGILTLGMFLFSLYTSVTYSIVNQELLKKMFEFNQNVKKFQEKIKETRDLIPGFFDTDYNSYSFLGKFYENKFKLTKDKGKIIVDFHKIKNKKDEVKNMLISLGKLDAYMSNVKLVKENPNVYCFSKIIKTDVPTIKAHDIFLPMSVNTPNKATKNTIEINGTNMLITGPNAEGKSTLIKSVALCLIMSQNLGIAPCKSLSHSYFDTIDTYLNVSDKKGEKSLFESELEIMQNYIEQIEKNPEQNSFIIIDEMFTGTNPQEGIATSMAICEQLASFKNSISIITTHYQELNELKDTDYTKYHMNKYKLNPGKNNRTNGIELLSKKFNKKIIKRAQEYKKNHIKTIN